MFWKLWPPPECSWLALANWVKFGPNLGHIGPKQPISKVETKEFGSLYIFENTHHYQCTYQNTWAYTSDKMGQLDQNWVKSWAIKEKCEFFFIFLSFMATRQIFGFLARPWKLEILIQVRKWKFLIFWYDMMNPKRANLIL